MVSVITTLAATAALAAISFAAAVVTTAGSADACAGLIGSNGAVNLGRTTTLAAYSDGVEHYVTAFEFQGGGGEFGSLIPLPAAPTNVERGGDWTLQRLQQESRQLRPAFGPTSGGSAGGAAVLQEVRIDALDLTVLEGGGPDVAVWAQAHGFRLSPDAPEVLDFYAQRSPIFLAAVFDSQAAADRGQQIGDGTPVHITMQTDNPWVPLRILGLGKQSQDLVSADVYLLTEREPALLPAPRDGLFLEHSGEARQLLLDDLRADAGMSWVPHSGWLTKLVVASPTEDLAYDLAVDASGAGRPSRLASGLDVVPRSLPQTGGEIGATPDAEGPVPAWVILAGLTAAFAGLAALRLRPHGARQ
jgi:hypothetical protein